MRLLICLLFITSAAYGQSEESRLLFLAINGKRAELNMPKLSYVDSEQTELDTRTVMIAVEKQEFMQDACKCKSETVLTKESLKDLIAEAIDKTRNWQHIDPKSLKAAASVLNLDGKYYAVIRTY